MYSKIINPVTGKKVAINGKLGKTILRKYLFVLSGGAVQSTSDNIKDWLWSWVVKSPSDKDLHPVDDHGGQLAELWGPRHGLYPVPPSDDDHSLRPPPTPDKVSYNDIDIRLCSRSTHNGMQVTDKMPIPLIYVKAHGHTDSYIRTGVPSDRPSSKRSAWRGRPVVINSLPRITGDPPFATPSPFLYNGSIGIVVGLTDKGYHITSGPRTFGGYNGNDFIATRKQIMPIYESPLDFQRPVPYLTYGTSVTDGDGNQGVITSNFNSTTGNFNVLFDPLNTSSPQLRHHSALIPTSSIPFIIPPKTYIITFSDVGDSCLLDWKSDARGTSVEDRLVTDVLSPFLDERKKAAKAKASDEGEDPTNAQASDTLSDEEIKELQKSLKVFSGNSRDSDLVRVEAWRRAFLEPSLQIKLFKSNFNLHPPGNEMLDTWLHFRDGCTHYGVIPQGGVNVCDITCINTDSILADYTKAALMRGVGGGANSNQSARRLMDQHRCTDYPDDMLANEFHSHGRAISFRELIRNHGPGIYILSSCRSFARGTDPRKVEVATGAPSLVARQRSAERGGPFYNKPATAKGLQEAQREMLTSDTARPRCAVC